MEAIRIFLGLGSNLGDRQHHLALARQAIGRRIGPIQLTSSLYETQPWGRSDQPEFINQVIELRSPLSPEALMKTILELEQSLGRERRQKWAERVIDIDILAYGNKIVHKDGLHIPHPELHKRNFVLVPFMEIAGDWVHPELDLSIEELYFESRDPLDVVLLDHE